MTRAGPALLLDGQPWRFTGINAFSATSYAPVNLGCGPPIADLDTVFAGLHPGSAVRVWAFQALGWNDKDRPGHIDFTGIDRVVAAAERAHQQLILTLSDQSGTCDDGHWHDQAWYDGGYTQRYDDYGYGNGDRSYLDWVRLIVARYRDISAVAAWEPVNEPEASTCSGATGSACYGAQRTCSDSAELSLRSFYDAIGAEIHRLDPGSVVGTGVIGRKQCGVNGGGFVRLAQSPQVDLMTYHDYSGADETLPPDLQERIGEAADSAKPLVIEEAGIWAGPGCLTADQRSEDFAAKIRSAFAHGLAGYLIWDYAADAGSSCSYAVGPRDPLLALLSALTPG